VAYYEIPKMLVGTVIPGKRPDAVILHSRNADIEISDQVLKAMLSTTSATREVEHGFQTCLERDGSEVVGQHCVGESCSIEITDCRGKPSWGHFHTHPAWAENRDSWGRCGGSSPSAADLMITLATRARYACVSGANAGYLSCWRTRPELRENTETSKQAQWEALRDLHDLWKGENGAFSWASPDCALAYQTTDNPYLPDHNQVFESAVVRKDLLLQHLATRGIRPSTPESQAALQAIEQDPEYLIEKRRTSSIGYTRDVYALREEMLRLRKEMEAQGVYSRRMDWRLSQPDAV
jgi:hypothetical protein